MFPGILYSVHWCLLKKLKQMLHNLESPNFSSLFYIHYQLKFLPL